MKRFLLSLAVVASTCTAAAQQLPDSPKSTAPRSADQLRTAVKARASSFTLQKYSKLFADLAEPEVAKKLAISPEQSALIRRVDELTRDAFRAWLERDLETVPPPAATDLEGRLSDRGDHLRSRLLVHAEAIVLEAVLDGEQARRWRSRARQRAATLFRGRFPNWYPPALVGNEPFADLVDRLRDHAKVNSQPGFVSWALVGDATVRPRLNVPDEQRALIRRVDEVTGAAIRMWLKRGLEGQKLPKWSVLAERYLSSRKVTDSIKAHAEAIMLEAVLTPEQADQALEAVWKLNGLLALLDPALAGRLRLSVTQRQEVDELLREKYDFQGELSKLGDVGVALERMPEGEARQQLTQRAIAERHNMMDAAIWNVLTASQTRELERILGIKAQSPPGPKAKKSTRSG